jgi:HEAT repeat protein
MESDPAELAERVDEWAKTPGEDAARSLARALLVSSWSLRERAVRALSGRGDAVAPLLDVLAGGPWYAKASACDALARLSDARSAIPVLRALLDRNVTVQKSAARAVQELADRHGVDLVARALCALDPAERRAAAARLAHQAPDLTAEVAGALAPIETHVERAERAGAETDDPVREIVALRRFRAWIASHVSESERG